MKKHLLRTLILLCGLVFLNSCMKDDPVNNKTIYYGYQQIPNINEYMPQSLLLACKDFIYFGDEPPKIEGSFTADNTLVSNVIRTDESNWMMQNGMSIGGYRYFHFFEQHMGIANLKYLYYNFQQNNNTEITRIESSSNDTTVILLKDYLDQFLAETTKPIYFENDDFHEDVFKNVYIIGDDPYFTIYYYDIIWTNQFHPMKANIISGKIDKEMVIETNAETGANDTIYRPIIKDFKWGIENMIYFKSGDMLNLFLHPDDGNQRIPAPGDIVIFDNPTDVHQGEYQE